MGIAHGMVSNQVHQGHYQLAWICYSLSLLNAGICILKAFQSEGSAKAHGTFIRDDILSVSLRFRGYRVVHVCMYILFPSRVARRLVLRMHPLSTSLVLWCCSNAVCWAHSPSLCVAAYKPSSPASESNSWYPFVVSFLAQVCFVPPSTSP